MGIESVSIILEVDGYSPLHYVCYMGSFLYRVFALFPYFDRVFALDLLRCSAGSLSRAGRRRSMALVAAAATVWLLSGAPADAVPVAASTQPLNVPAGVRVSTSPDSTFDNVGTNPRFTAVTFSTMDYYDAALTGLNADGSYLFVKAKTAAQLNALAVPPPSPFTVTATMTMTNDDGQTATATRSLRTTYARAASSPPPSSDPPAAVPVAASTQPLNVPAGVRVSTSPDSTFDNVGTNPRFTAVTFSTMDYYDAALTGLNADGSYLFVKAKTAAQLNALAVPPPSPFTVTATMTMTNDDGQTATATRSLRTTYARAASSPPPSSDPPAAVPVAASTQPLNVPAGVRVSTSPDSTFDNVGTNPRFTAVTFSTMDYYDAALTGLNADGSYLFVKAKTAAQLNALAVPPPSPFTVTATMTMTNDDGQTATATRSLRTAYPRTAAAPPAPAQSQPTFIATSNISAVPGVTSRVRIDEIFANRGTNARVTAAVFSTMDYYGTQNTGVAYRGTYLYVHAKTDAELNALAEPPPSPFTVTATVTMTNDDDQTASGTITFETTYTRPSGAPLAGTSPPTVMPGLSPVNAPPGAISGTSAPSVFENPGTNARFTAVEFSTLDYYVARFSRILDGRLQMFVKTSAQLNALAEPPPSPFTVTATLTMTNDEGHTATGTVSIQTTYARDD